MEEILDKVDKIVTDQKILRQVSRETTQEEVQKLNLMSRLFHANKAAWTKGVGLAAIQIGVPVRFAYYTHNGKSSYLMNPRILKIWGEDTIKEGCLSIPGKWLMVKRAVTIEYESFGKVKTAHGFEARIIQHEIDHMDGILVNQKGGVA